MGTEAPFDMPGAGGAGEVSFEASFVAEREAEGELEGHKRDDTEESMIMDAKPPEGMVEVNGDRAVEKMDAFGEREEEESLVTTRVVRLQLPLATIITPEALPSPRFSFTIILAFPRLSAPTSLPNGDATAPKSKLHVPTFALPTHLSPAQSVTTSVSASTGASVELLDFALLDSSMLGESGSLGGEGESSPLPGRKGSARWRDVVRSPIPDFGVENLPSNKDGGKGSVEVEVDWGSQEKEREKVKSRPASLVLTEEDIADQGTPSRIGSVRGKEKSKVTRRKPSLRDVALDGAARGGEWGTPTPVLRPKSSLRALGGAIKSPVSDSGFSTPTPSTTSSPQQRHVDVAPVPSSPPQRPTSARSRSRTRSVSRTTTMIQSLDVRITSIPPKKSSMTSKGKGKEQEGWRYFVLLKFGRPYFGEGFGFGEDENAADVCCAWDEEGGEVPFVVGTEGRVEFVRAIAEEGEEEEEKKGIKELLYTVLGGAGGKEGEVGAVLPKFKERVGEMKVEVLSVDGELYVVVDLECQY
ncbi:FAD dependent oxidoreductase [Pseudohyphozyma bogoriensis]|nr:FAD dependent oxidoreductase [Pseudohyphozyma bogoriensis]